MNAQATILAGMCVLEKGKRDGERKSEPNGVQRQLLCRPNERIKDGYI